MDELGRARGTAYLANLIGVLRHDVLDDLPMVFMNIHTYYSSVEVWIGTLNYLIMLVLFVPKSF